MIDIAIARVLEESMLEILSFLESNESLLTLGAPKTHPGLLHLKLAEVKNLVFLIRKTQTSNAEFIQNVLDADNKLSPLIEAILKAHNSNLTLEGFMQLKVPLNTFNKLFEYLDKRSISHRSSILGGFNPEEISLIFSLREFSTEDISGILSLFSDLYRSIGGDELEIRGTNIYESEKEAIIM